MEENTARRMWIRRYGRTVNVTWDACSRDPTRRCASRSLPRMQNERILEIDWAYRYGWVPNFVTEVLNVKSSSRAKVRLRSGNAAGYGRWEDGMGGDDNEDNVHDGENVEDKMEYVTKKGDHGKDIEAQYRDSKVERHQHVGDDDVDGAQEGMQLEGGANINGEDMGENMILSSSFSGSKSFNSAIAQALDIAVEIMRLLQEGEKDAILAYLPDSVIDAACEHNSYSTSNDDGKAENSLSRDIDIMELLDRFNGSEAEFKTNTIALRVLFLCPPAQVKALSSLQISQKKCLQRFAVLGQFGEEAIVNMQLELQETLEARYRSARVVEKWFLTGIIGENMCPRDELPEGPAPKYGPEDVVTVQLDAFRLGNLETAWSFMSPLYRSKFCSGTFDEFLSLFSKEPFSTLKNHAASEILSARHISMTPSRIFVVVGIAGHEQPENSTKRKSVFLWTLHLQSTGSQESNRSTGQYCWLTETIERLSDNGILPYPPP